MSFGNLTADEQASFLATCQVTEEDAEGVYPFMTMTSQLFLVLTGSMVFLMQSGFALLEAGSIESTAVVNILFKNTIDKLVSGLAWWSVGWAFAYGGSDSGFIAYHQFFMHNTSPCDYGSWFFQWTFAATAATIVSGAMAGRTQLVAYICYSFFLTGIIYPVVVHWTWSSNAWLAQGSYADDDVVAAASTTDGHYRDFAGSGIVHVCGGTAALVGAYMVGPRGEGSEQRFAAGCTKKFLPSSIPFIVLGTFILIFGFFGFNGGSVLAMNSIDDAVAMTRAVANTVLAASGGGCATLLIGWMMRNVTIGLICNGAIVGMVAICAGANVVNLWAAWVMGFIAGMAYCGWSNLMVKYKIDDPVDAISVHLGGGIWGVLAVPLFAATDDGESIFYDGTQAAFKDFAWAILGVVVIMLWTASTIGFLFYVLNSNDMLRSPAADLIAGLDKAEHGEQAYSISSEPSSPGPQRATQKQETPFSTVNGSLEETRQAYQQQLARRNGAIATHVV